MKRDWDCQGRAPGAGSGAPPHLREAGAAGLARGRQAPAQLQILQALLRERALQARLPHAQRPRLLVRPAQPLQLLAYAPQREGYFIRGLYPPVHAARTSPCPPRAAAAAVRQGRQRDNPHSGGRPLHGELKWDSLRIVSWPKCRPLSCPFCKLLPQVFRWQADAALCSYPGDIVSRKVTPSLGPG